MGDPAGVGPEITLKALQQLAEASRPISAVVYGSMRALQESASRDGIACDIVASEDGSTWPRVAIAAVPEPTGLPDMGRVSAHAGEVAYAAIARAVSAAKAGRIGAIVTAPISKEALNLAGHDYSGHTEMLADLAGVKGVCMMLAHGNLRVSHVVSGPIPGDTIFVRTLAREFDAAVAIYHDQGHIPVKLLGFRIDQDTGRWLGLSGVNVTLGLPFIRTSVDHGTAFDIAGKGIASAQSMKEAIDFALDLAARGASASSPATGVCHEPISAVGPRFLCNSDFQRRGVRGERGAYRRRPSRRGQSRGP